MLCEKTIIKDEISGGKYNVFDYTRDIRRTQFVRVVAEEQFRIKWVRA